MTIDSILLDGTARTVTGLAAAMTDPWLAWLIVITVCLVVFCAMMRLLQAGPSSLRRIRK